MALIHEISGSLLLRLAERAGGGASSGQGESAGSFSTADRGSIAEGLSFGASSFQDSTIRLNEGLNVLRLSSATLTELSSVAEDLLQLAQKAAKTETTTEERTRLDAIFQAKILQFQKIMSGAESGTKDALDSSDLQEALVDSGIDFTRSSALASAFSGLGGGDGELGYEKVTLADERIVNPLMLDVETIDNADDAAEAFTSLRAMINAEQERLFTVTSELEDSIRFAFQARQSFLNKSGESLSNNNAEEIAKSIVAEIKRNTSDPALAAHSDLDRILAATLLGA